MANGTDTRSSPRFSSSSSGGGGGGGDSPQSQSRRNGKNNSNLSAPWSHVVRGESETIPAGQSSSSSYQEPDSMMTAAVTGTAVAAAAETMTTTTTNTSSLLESSSSVIDADSSDNVNINVAPMKKPAWNKPSNGVVEVGNVMGASSWPALSESAKASPKSSSDSLKALSDGSVSVTQGPVIASAPQKQVNSSNANPNSTTNHAYPTRQKSMKRGSGGGGGGGGPVNGGFNQPPPLPSPSPAVETQQNSSGKPGHVVMDSSPREHPHYKGNNNWEGGPRGGGFMSQHHTGNDHPQQHRNSFRRHNGPHPNSYGGGRHNQDRGNHEWNSHRNFNGRNIHMQQQRVPGNFQRAPPPSTPPFISPQPVPPFPNPLGFPVYYVQGPPPESLRGMPMVPAPSLMYVSPPDAPLRARIIKQIDYYFSPENLCKDTYLRQNMDDQGWVSISVIAPWNRVKQLTTNIQLILDALRASLVVEVQGDKLRKRNDWMNWPRLPPNQFVSVPVAQSSGVSTHDMLADRFKNVRLEEGKSNNVNITTRSLADTPADPAISRSSSEDLNNLPSNVQWGGPEQATVRLGSD